MPTPTETAGVPDCNLALNACILEGHFWFQRPIALPNNDGMDKSYLFGTTQAGRRVPHHGVEFQNPSGTPVLAVADGDVIVAGNDEVDAFSPWTGMYGNLVILEHHLTELDKVVFTLYAHLSQIDVVVGQHVQVGDPIGMVGLSGAAIGSHLHFEVRLGADSYAENRNPALWLQPGEAQGVLAGMVLDATGQPVQATLRVQYYPEREGVPVYAYQVETYASEQPAVKGDDAWQENFAIGDLPPGWYRITLMQGNLIESWAEVAAGKLTLVLIEVE